jgi:hypothetical protein
MFLLPEYIPQPLRPPLVRFPHDHSHDRVTVGILICVRPAPWSAPKV